jgi:RNA polymerase sigma-70 factor (ECF subfamily)
MEPSRRDDLEREIRRHVDEGQVPLAAASAVQGYGPEIFGFLVALHRREDDAAEVFSRFTEKVLRGLPTFEWQCSFRTWAYAIARNLSATYRRETRRRDRRHVPLSGWSELSAVEQKVRSQTASYLRTERKTQVAALRQTLSAEDQALLVLRVDRKLAWNDLARVMKDDDGSSLSPEAMTREVARLRKRFQLIKDRLYELGRRQGLVEADRDPG